MTMFVSGDLSPAIRVYIFSKVLSAFLVNPYSTDKRIDTRITNITLINIRFLFVNAEDF